MHQSHPERYKFAEQLYCFTEKTIPEIAEIADIPVRTLYRRAADYKWSILRRASRRSPMILAEEMYRELADLTAIINARPEGQRIPTPSEAELRRKIITSIAAIKKFPTHAEALFILQSLIRYNDHFYGSRIIGMEHLVDSFLSHRDVYGFASYQPEHNQDVNKLSDYEQEMLQAKPTTREGTGDDLAYEHDYTTSASYLEFMKNKNSPIARAEIIDRFKSESNALPTEASNGTSPISPAA